LILYGCEISFLILREEDGLRASENRMLRIFGLKIDEAEVTGGWEGLSNEELHNL
jgi:hypothetical protein